MTAPAQRVLLAVLVAAVLAAGCTGPGDDDGGEFTEETPLEDGVGAESPTPDNDAGAEPGAPAAGRNGTATISPGPAGGNDTASGP